MDTLERWEDYQIAAAVSLAKSFSSGLLSPDSPSSAVSRPAWQKKQYRAVSRARAMKINAFQKAKIKRLVSCARARKQGRKLEASSGKSADIQEQLDKYQIKELTRMGVQVRDLREVVKSLRQHRSDVQELCLQMLQLPFLDTTVAAAGSSVNGQSESSSKPNMTKAEAALDKKTQRKKYYTNVFGPQEGGLSDNSSSEDMEFVSNTTHNIRTRVRNSIQNGRLAEERKGNAQNNNLLRAVQKLKATKGIGRATALLKLAHEEIVAEHSGKESQ
ncbi:unnamed protein product [Amoebophrya sp. A25]|nr:unnamed protein product [Amoebophrya sp. A25]|eukprot:GSA25T00021205001.1